MIVINYGGGTNSTALLVEAHRKYLGRAAVRRIDEAGRAAIDDGFVKRMDEIRTRRGWK